MIPTAIGGGDNTYYADNTWIDTTGELSLVGGVATHLSKCGVATFRSLYAYTVSGMDIGARMAFYGTPTIVSGSQLVAM